MKRLSKIKRQRKIFYAGMLFMGIGFWMIFIARDNFGFIPGIIGALLLHWEGKKWLN